MRVATSAVIGSTCSLTCWFCQKQSDTKWQNRQRLAYQMRWISFAEEILDWASCLQTKFTSRMWRHVWCVFLFLISQISVWNLARQVVLGDGCQGNAFVRTLAILSHPYPTMSTYSALVFFFLLRRYGRAPGLTFHSFHPGSVFILVFSLVFHDFGLQNWAWKWYKSGTIWVQGQHQADAARITIKCFHLSLVYNQFLQRCLRRCCDRKSELRPERRKQEIVWIRLISLACRSGNLTILS